MTDRNSDRKYTWFICGKCGHEIYSRKSEDIPNCTECGAVYDATGDAKDGGTLVEIREWTHKDRKVNDIPTEIKLNLADL